MSAPDSPEKPGTSPDSQVDAPTLVRPRASPALGGEESPASAFPPGQVLAGRYTVLDWLGEGGMGVVLAAYDSRLDRRVALKLLRSRAWEDGGLSEGQARLVREAQAMARLSHPHVVAVYDAGTLEDGSVYIAMEYVRGRTLRRWCEEPARSWREVLSAYLASGRGLAAAHAAGLIHRDFKPDNVLVGEDGRARVTDFGLARAGSIAPGLPPAAAALPPSTLDTPLTQAGTLMGTPAYMAPELLEGGAADVRTDVYAFCVSLYEALYGQHPFEEGRLRELLVAQHAGRVRPPPVDAKVPAWVFHALRQGLRAPPELRPPSMEVLLTALEADPEAKRRARPLAAALAAMVLVLAGLLIWSHVRERGAGCETQARHRLAGVWDGPVRTRVRDALVATRLPHAHATAERVEAVLEGYARHWVHQRVEVCEARSPSRAAPPRSLALLREACLERGRSQLHALTGLLARGPDAALIDTAVQAAQALSPLTYCADVKALTAAVPPPEDAAVRARVEALEVQVDRLEVLHEAGKYTEARGLLAELLPHVEGVAHAPLHARTLYLEAQVLEGAGDYPGAERTMRRALAEGARGKDLPRVALAWSRLLDLVGHHQGRPSDALALEPALEVSVALADDDSARILALNSMGRVLASLGRYEEARQKQERALALQLEVLGPEHSEVAASLSTLGITLQYLGRYEEDRQKQERALALRMKVLGPEHPRVAASLLNLGVVLQHLDRYEEARDKQEQALALGQKLLGPEHPLVAASLNNLGVVLGRLGRHEEAKQRYEQSLALGRKSLGPEHPSVANSLDNLGVELQALGRYPEARQMHEQALALRLKALGPEHPDVATSLLNLGLVLGALGHSEEARSRFSRALALQEKAFGSESPDLTEFLLAWGTFLLVDQARPVQALPLLERASRLAPPASGPEARFLLARALWDAGKDRPRAVKLALEAQQDWRRGPSPRLTEVSRWLALHRLP